MSLTDKIAEIEEEIANTKYNKATQHHVGKLKAKLAQLREEVVTSSSGPKGSGYGVRKAGDATVALVGLPSVGKSTLLNSLTDAESETGSYAFTPLDVVPGVFRVFLPPSILSKWSRGFRGLAWRWKSSMWP